MPGVLEKAGEAVKEWLRDRFCRPCAFGRGALQACRGCRVLEAEEKAEELVSIVLDAAGAAEIGETPAAAAWPEAGRQDEVPAYVVAVRRVVRGALQREEGGSGGGRRPGGEGGVQGGVPLAAAGFPGGAVGGGVA